jgi:[acyl-carrier-protein] S-malonyltransferase
MGVQLCRESTEARRAFQLAGEAVGVDLLTLCRRGPLRSLTSTAIAQPAIFACNVAAHVVLRKWGYQPSVVAGHSVGEFSALWAAGVLRFDDALQVVVTRAHLMGTIRAKGAMAAISGLSYMEVVTLCNEVHNGEPLVVALHNAPGQVVVSGSPAAVERCLAIAGRRGAHRVVRLATSNAFHSPLMSEAAKSWAEVVARLPLSEPAIPIALNVTGQLATSVDDIREGMLRQLTELVDWAACIRAMLTFGARGVVEVGDSRVLCGLVRLAAPGVPTATMKAPRTLRNVEAVTVSREI